MTDQEMIVFLHTNPQRGFEIIINQYTGLMYKIAYNKLSSVCTREDIEECVSDIFVLFYEQRAAIDLSRGSIKSFLMILAKRTAIKRFNSACSTNTKLTSIDDETLSPKHLIAKEDITSPFEKETRLMLIGAVKALEEPDCTIILRKYYLGETAKEIAKSVYLSQNAVEKRIARNLKKLKNILGGI
jgi:RNA polymerase sigma-70 factor (ECF subfamily)